MKVLQVGVKIKHVVSADNITQYFFICAFQDYFLDETYSFYRHLNDFIENFYLPYPIKSISRGKNQFILKYNREDGQDLSVLKDIDQLFDVTYHPREEWCCQNCLYLNETKCTCEGAFKELPVENCCANWTEED